MGERRRYRRLKVRLPLSFSIPDQKTEGTGKKARPAGVHKIGGETYDIAMEGLTIDVMLSPQDMAYLMPIMAKSEKGPRVDVEVKFEGNTVSMAGTVIWYNLFFPGTPPPNFKAGLYFIEPDSNPSKQKWNDFIENLRL
ncbi:MAG: hypothetical protein GTO13_02190 [Proteobacteria bacterium]|nr:hypothetical protein [Pseudomonadota bacterium]